jgi:hypothetical protein
MVARHLGDVAEMRRPVMQAGFAVDPDLAES